ncbi:MAG: FecR domain-containing protein, partial [Cyanobacteria bacterium P01_C01_bin.70]
ELLPESGTARSATLSDRLNLGDAIRTATNSRADLRFNDGSLARIGERATFWFVPNTRNFRLSNGTALFLVPPGRGPSTIETPGVVTGIQGTAILIRHIAAAPVSESPVQDWGASSAAGRTIVMALTNNPGGPVRVELANGQTAALVAGQMAIAADGTIEVFEFDLQLFYETSLLVEGLYLDDPNYPDTGLPIDSVRQETLDGLLQQAVFVGDTVLSSDVVNVEGVDADTFGEPGMDVDNSSRAANQEPTVQSSAHVNGVDSRLLPIDRPQAVTLPAPSDDALDPAADSPFGQGNSLPGEVSDDPSSAGGASTTVPTAGVIDPTVTPATTVTPPTIATPTPPSAGTPAPTTPSIPATPVTAADETPIVSDPATPAILDGETPPAVVDGALDAPADGAVDAVETPPTP